MTDFPDLPVLVLRAASQLVDAIQEGVAARGFTDVRPSHGFAFARISSGDATASDLAEHLGVTKQAAGQLVDQLVDRGYVTREADPTDARARLLRLTDRGWACTRAADDAAREVVEQWRDRLDPATYAALGTALRTVVTPGRLRPAW
ncbi:winged helix-turn-helix transcriptional regulator [Rhodococcus sp. CX]|uniref:MarR family winged helix-turn-helix transcriptional regulator n=1 Tax=Rhodococcus sp. CX TaxID=2789880 RepID=UPI0018CCFD5A|nr:MarR family winged helix-turn-helix transcriptional regulator [Rhodococcus sp. CX]MBH0118141.1 winged helix-turn-helix transcriptional regulator [Rhodococcus sp. CX]